MRILLVSTLIALCFPVTAEVIHREKSLYRNIIVNQVGDKRCLVFSVKRQQRNQTCIDLKDPKRIVFPYVRMTFSGLLVNPDPKRALMIGMGGGTISNVLADIYPDLVMDLVEVDPAVVQVAREYFAFESTPRTRVHILDGRVFTRRASLNQEKYDLIILDAFTGEYIPEHLMTMDFLKEARDLLTPDGVLVANTFSGSALYDHESVTYAAVFGQFFNLRMSGTGNRVIVASRLPLPDNKSMMAVARLLRDSFRPYGVDLQQYVVNMDREEDWDKRKRPLTDQYSPANLLRNR